MAVDTYTARARFILQGTGNNLNVWGQKLNISAIQLVEDAIMGAVAITVSGAVTLTSNLGMTDQSRMAVLQCSGSGGTITAPAVQNRFLIDAKAMTGPVVVTTGSGASATVPAGLVGEVYSPDGASYYLTDSPTSRAYTDAAVLKNNSGNLPGSASNGQVIFTRNGNAVWDFIGTTDVTGLSTTIANQNAAIQASANLAVAFAVAL